MNDSIRYLLVYGFVVAGAGVFFVLNDSEGTFDASYLAFGLGIILWTPAVFGMITGSVVCGYEMVRRKEKPVSFWLGVGFSTVLAFICFYVGAFG